MDREQLGHVDQPKRCPLPDVPPIPGSRQKRDRSADLDCKFAFHESIRWRRANGGNAKPCGRGYMRDESDAPKRLRFVLEDLDAPSPATVKASADFWREHWTRPFFPDAMALRLVIEGSPPNAPKVVVELDFHDDWTAVHELVRQDARWVPSGTVEFTERSGNPTVLTTRLRRSASLERHLPRVERLIADAVALDTRLTGDWWEILAYDWQMTGPRSRRGRTAKIDADEIDRLRTEEGLSLPEIAEIFGVHRKTPGNVLFRARQRQIPALPDDE